MYVIPNVLEAMETHPQDHDIVRVLPKQSEEKQAVEPMSDVTREGKQ